MPLQSNNISFSTAAQGSGRREEEGKTWTRTIERKRKKKKKERKKKEKKGKQLRLLRTQNQQHQIPGSTDDTIREMGDILVKVTATITGQRQLKEQPLCLSQSTCKEVRCALTKPVYKKPTILFVSCASRLNIRSANQDYTYASQEITNNPSGVSVQWQFDRASEWVAWRERDRQTDRQTDTQTETDRPDLRCVNCSTVSSPPASFTPPATPPLLSPPLVPNPSCPPPPTPSTPSTLPLPSHLFLFRISLSENVFKFEFPLSLTPLSLSL